MGRGRRVRGLAVTCVLTAVLVGCDAGGASPGPGSPATPPGAGDPTDPPGTPAQPVYLTFAVYGDDAVVAAYQRIADVYTAQAPHVDLELTTFPDALSAADEVAAAAGTGQGPDLFLLDQVQLPRMVVQEAVAPLDEALDERGLQFGDDFQRSALMTFSADAQLQCMPVEMSPLVVYYNRDLVPRQALKDRGLVFPRRADTWTWETFEAAARAVAEKDLLGPVKGTWVPPRLDLVTALLRSGGDGVVDDDLDPRSLTLSSEDAVETLTAVVRLASDPVVSLTPADLVQRDAVDWFASGDLGMLIGTRADLPRLRAAVSRGGLDFGVVPLPSFGRSSSTSEATGLCVAADSDAVADAADFVAFAVGPRAARIAAATGQVVPSRLETLTSEVFTQPRLLPRQSQAFLAGAKRSQPLPYSLQWPVVTSRVEEELRRLLSPQSADLGPRALTRRLARLDEQSQVVLGDGSAD